MANSEDWQQLLHPGNFIACGFGSGLIPKAPGTAGTLVAIPLVLVIQQFSLLEQWIVCLLMFIFGCYVCGVAAKSFGSEDPGKIVWDEMTGYCIAMVAIPVSVMTIILSFFIFRMLDIFKPFPIRLVERKLKGGFGIMADDAIAGFITNLILLLFLHFFIS